MDIGGGSVEFIIGNENGFTWTPPTAEAYAKVCGALMKRTLEADAKKAGLMMAITLLEDLRGGFSPAVKPADWVAQAKTALESYL